MREIDDHARDQTREALRKGLEQIAADPKAHAKFADEHDLRGDDRPNRSLAAQLMCPQ